MHVYLRSSSIPHMPCSFKCKYGYILVSGPYEAGVARYKHMYFNATDNTFKIWALTVVCAIVFYECIKNIIRLCLNNQIRYNMAFLFILSMFSHYYSWLVTIIMAVHTFVNLLYILLCSFTSPNNFDPATLVHHFHSTRSPAYTFAHTFASHTTCSFFQHTRAIFFYY